MLLSHVGPSDHCWILRISLPLPSHLHRWTFRLALLLSRLDSPTFSSIPQTFNIADTYNTCKGHSNPHKKGETWYTIGYFSSWASVHPNRYYSNILLIFSYFSVFLMSYHWMCTSWLHLHANSNIMTSSDSAATKPGSNPILVNAVNSA